MKSFFNHFAARQAGFCKQGVLVAFALGALPLSGQGQKAGLTRLQLPNTPVRTVLQVYEKLTGKAVILDNTVIGNIYIFVRDPLPHREAIRIIESTLLLNGFTLVPMDKKTVKVLGPGKNARSEAIPVYTHAQDLPEGDQVVNYILKLQYADPEKTQQFLTQFIPQTPFSAVAVLPDSNGLVMTHSSSVIRNIIKIVQRFDLPSAELITEIIPLKRADVVKVVEQVNAIISTKEATEVNSPRQIQQAETSGGIPASERPELPGERLRPSLANRIPLSEDAIVLGKVKITADERTNRIYLVSRPVNIPFLRQLILDLDANVEFGSPVSRPLMFVSAKDILPILVETLKEPGIEETESKAKGRGTSTSTAGAGSSSSGGSSGTGGLSLTEQLQTEPIDVSPKAITIGSTRLIADGRTNSIVVMANEDAKQKVFQILDRLDVRAPQVLLNVVIGELTLDTGEEFGIDYFFKVQGRDVSTAGQNRTTNVPAASAKDFTSLVPFQALSGLSGLTGFIAIGSVLDMTLRALETTNRFKVISRPTVFTTNNKKAVIASGREVAVPVSSLTQQVGTGDGVVPVTSSSIQFKPIILQLEVVPIINDRNEVSMEILQKIDNQTGTTIIDNNEIPEISTRFIRTNVTVPSGSTVVLGGLITSTSDRRSRGMPFLSRIPLLGYLFSGINKDRERTELVIMIRPTVTADPQEVDETNQKVFSDYLLPRSIEKEIRPTQNLPGPPGLVPVDRPFPLMESEQEAASIEDDPLPPPARSQQIRQQSGSKRHRLH